MNSFPIHRSAHAQYILGSRNGYFLIALFSNFQEKRSPSREGTVQRYEDDKMVVHFERVGYKTLGVAAVSENGLLRLRA